TMSSSASRNEDATERKGEQDRRRTQPHRAICPRPALTTSRLPRAACVPAISQYIRSIFARLFHSRFPKPNTGATTVLVDECAWRIPGEAPQAAEFIATNSFNACLFANVLQFRRLHRR